MPLWFDRSFRVLPGCWLVFDCTGRLSVSLGRNGFFVNVGGGRGTILSRGNPAAGVPYADEYGYRKDGAPFNRPRTRRPTSVTGWLFVGALATGAWWCHAHHTTLDALGRHLLHVVRPVLASFGR